MKRGLQGRFLVTSTRDEMVKAFIPNPLPPNPPISWNAALHDKFDRALIELGRLDSISTLLPDRELFLYMYIRKEAVLSSQIEGTQSSLSDLLLFELNQTPGVPINDVQEVSNYVAAINKGLELLAEGLPISLRLLKEVHKVLLDKGRGNEKQPGEFRTSQNWVGGSRPGNAVYVPPPPYEVMAQMGRLELFLHDKPEKTPILLKIALTHVQFETIHPFLDGNGRIGRLLITLLLYEQKILREPLLYLSLYFKFHRNTYYELLNEVRFSGDWEKWLDFFADAVVITAKQAVQTAQKLIKMKDTDKGRISNNLGRSAANAQLIHNILMHTPIITSVDLVKKSELNPTTVNNILSMMIKLGIVNELTGKKRNRVYCYNEYLKIMNENIEF